MDDDEEPMVTASKSKVVDNDDTDDFIRGLKEKTSRKPMADILSDLERRNDVTPPKFEPVPSFKDTFKPSPSPERNYASLGRNRRKASRASSSSRNAGK